jgi:glycosyltransferase involved in cell wall biosynthesis
MKISIITPVYNSEKTIQKCIKSVIKQVYQNWELILINDCSNDKTKEIIENYCKIDSRIILNNNLVNQKSLISRINGIKIANGDFITFLDADDWFDQNALNSFIENFKQTKADVILGAWQRTFDNYGIFKTKPLNLYYDKLIEGVYENEEIEKNFGFSFFAKHGLPVVNWAKLYKKELFDHLLHYPFPNIVKGEDLYLNILVFENVKKISFIKDLILYYRDGGISQKLVANYLENVNELYLLRKKILENSTKKEQAYLYINEELANTFYFYFIDCVYIEKFDIEQIKNKYYEYKNNESYQDFISNLSNKDILHYNFFYHLENGNFEKAHELLTAEISKFRFKRGLRREIGNLLLKL